MAARTKTALEAMSIGIELVLKLSILGLLIFAIAFPRSLADRVRTALDAAGFELTEISLFGTTFKVRTEDLSEFQASLERTDAEFYELELKNASLREFLACERQNNCSQAQSSLIFGILADASEADPAVIETARANAARELANVIESIEQARLAARIPEADNSPEPDSRAGHWVIVVGADRSLDGAMQEKQRLASGGYEASVVKRGNFFRTITLFGNQAAASEQRKPIEDLMGRKVFVLAMEDWCPEPSEDPAGFLQCN